MRAYHSDDTADWWRETYTKEKVKGFMVLNFWRPVEPMKGPILKDHLAVCEPDSVSFDDALPTSLIGQTVNN